MVKIVLFSLLIIFLVIVALFTALILYAYVKDKTKKRSGRTENSMSGTTYNAIELNAAIETMLDEKADLTKRLEGAKVIINYGHSLNSQGFLSVEASFNSGKKGPPTTGFSPGHGNVTISSNSNKDRSEPFSSTTKERVGKYRIWKLKDGILMFHGFWASNTVTRADKSLTPEYELRYDTKTLALISLTFNEVDEERGRSFLGVLQISRTNRHHLLGEKMGTVEYL
ncbi:MAG: hypothetical protein G01um101413_698 [Parcubacteria group bacterium Gr01-1014_13]|nr:MAG: hypothetical protein G01um101413_698 [Parcubacteria group bacterium Gr01-1014_13]